MNHSAKKQHHEKVRKQHKHDLEQHAREAAKRERSKVPMWILAAGVVCVVAVVLLVALW
jgi:type VI protein secretion system component VasF